MTLQGTQVRQFRIMEPLGEGGMGDVYLGYDEKLNRKVALKVLRKEHRLRPAAKARLLREARLLSQLDHPHICRIYDFVEEADAEFLVLELIEGKGLRQQFKEGVEERQAMQIALEVAGVLVAAHGQGVVHRDLKPENVMITPEGGVKVLDFGIARSIKEGAAADGSELAKQSVAKQSVAEQSVAEKIAAAMPAVALADTEDSETRTLTLDDTALGSVTGTVAYMSPEQARSEPISASSDMYSFGLLLQELFTGKSPYAKETSPALLLLRASRADTLPVVGVDADLAALIERLKSLEPAARPAALDAAERLKWICDKPRRRRLRNLKIAAMVFLALIAAVMTFLTIRVGRERDRANREATRANSEATRANQEAQRANQEAEAAREVSDFLVDLFEVSDPIQARGNTITAREILDRGAAKIDQELAGQPLTQARMMHTISTVYRGLGLNDQAEPLAERSLEIREQLLTPQHPDLARSLVHLANLYRFDVRLDESQELYLRALEIQEKALDPNDPELANTLTELGTFYWYQRRLDDAERVLQRAGQIWSQVGPDTLEEARSMDDLAWVYAGQGKYSEAKPRFRKALAIRERLLETNHPDVARTLNGLAVVEHALGRFPDAEATYERCLVIRETIYGKKNPYVGWVLNGLGGMYVDQGRYSEARKVFQRALGIPLDPPNRSLSLSGLADVHAAQARYREAEDFYQQALRILEENPWGGDPSNVQYSLAKIYAAEGRSDKAEPLFGQALEAWESPDIDDHPSAAEFLNSMADYYVLKERYAEATPLYHRAREIAETRLGASHPEVARSLDGLARIAVAEDRPDEARHLFQRALTNREKTLGPNHPSVAVTQRGLARLHLDQGRAEEAEPLFQRALAIRRAIFGPQHPLVIESRLDEAELRRAMEPDQD